MYSGNFNAESWALVCLRVYVLVRLLFISEYSRGCPFMHMVKIHMYLSTISSICIYYGSESYKWQLRVPCILLIPTRIIYSLHTLVWLSS